MTVWGFLTLTAAAILAAALPSAATTAAERTAWDFNLTRIEGGALSLAGFAGRPVLLVNTASMCGFTYQYGALQELWERNRARGLVVLGVPSGDFGGQEYDSSGEIQTFCEVNFAVDFPMADKEHVRGDEAHPLYRWLAATLGPDAEPRWNFHKILIGRDGLPRAAWGSGTEPDDRAIGDAIEQALEGSAGSGVRGG